MENKKQNKTRELNNFSSVSQIEKVFFPKSSGRKDPISVLEFENGEGERAIMEDILSAQFRT